MYCVKSAVAAALIAFSWLSMSAERTQATEIDQALNSIRTATERFKDVNVALAEGYLADPNNMCEMAENVGQPAHLGVMGIHYFRPDLLGITETEPRVNGNGMNLDFENPSILIYEPQEDGSLALVAVENLVFIEAWEAAGNTEPPMLLGRSWDRMVDDPATEVDEAHGFAPHYDQHVWVFRDNPNGSLEPFNPAATCAHHMAHAE